MSDRTRAVLSWGLIGVAAVAILAAQPEWRGLAVAIPVFGLVGFLTMWGVRNWHGSRWRHWLAFAGALALPFAYSLWESGSFAWSLVIAVVVVGSCFRLLHTVRCRVERQGPESEWCLTFPNFLRRGNQRGKAP